ncbi:MAG: hypothetical protein KGI08_09235 [Thaumarchaeota archaeon]|nr:hypothetical protein [Nitrososphaerota archaeon]
MPRKPKSTPVAVVNPIDLSGDAPAVVTTIDTVLTPHVGPTDGIAVIDPVAAAQAALAKAKADAKAKAAKDAAKAAAQAAKQAAKAQRDNTPSRPGTCGAVLAAMGLDTPTADLVAAVDDAYGTANARETAFWLRGVRAGVKAYLAAMTAQAVPPTVADNA